MNPLKTSILSFGSFIVVAVNVGLTSLSQTMESEPARATLGQSQNSEAAGGTAKLGVTGARTNWAEIYLQTGQMDAARRTAALLNLAPSDEPTLIWTYRHSKNDQARGLAEWAMARVGSDESVRLLTNALTNQYEGQNLNEIEVRGLLYKLRELGFLAGRNGGAYQFLEAAVEESFWQRHRKWEAKGPPDLNADMNRRLVGHTIQALGVSGRPQARKLLLRLKERELGYIWNYSGPIVTAFAYYDYVNKHGTDAMLEAFTRDGAEEAFSGWINTSEGKEWNNWSFEVMRRYMREKKIEPPQPPAAQPRK